MKKIIIILILCCFSDVMAQQATVSSGGNATGTTGSSSYTIGQVANSNFTGSNGKINQGVQQPFEIFTLGIDDFPEIMLAMSVYPNPTASWVTLSISNYDLEKMNYKLFDIHGRQIQAQEIAQSETQIVLENLASAIYLLQVSNDKKVLKTFKIIKN